MAKEKKKHQKATHLGVEATLAAGSTAPNKNTNTRVWRETQVEKKKRGTTRMEETGRPPHNPLDGRPTTSQLHHPVKGNVGTGFPHQVLEVHVQDAASPSHESATRVGVTVWPAEAKVFSPRLPRLALTVGWQVVTNDCPRSVPKKKPRKGDRLG